MISVWKSAQPVNHLAITCTHQSPGEMKAKGTVIRLTEEKKKMEGVNRKLRRWWSLGKIKGNI